MSPFARVLSPLLCAALAAHICAQQTSWLAATPPTMPSARHLHAMAQDPGRDRVVMFGGRDLAALGDTWEWDGADWIRASTAAPPARSEHAMAYCGGSARIVMFGGKDTASLPLADTWEWDGRAWAQRTLAVSPAARFGHAMATDYLNLSAVLFGGVGLNGATNDTWVWGGLTWQHQTLAVSPERRSYHAMAYDPARLRVVLFGGFDQAGQLVNNDTWEWDGTTWTRIPSTSTTPARRAGLAMAFDPVARRVILHGGLGATGVLGDTWSWNGATWVAQAPGSLRWGSALAPDYPRRVMRFGGHDGSSSNGETWLYGVLVPATSHAFGTPCFGGTTIPRLTSPRPYLGNPSFGLTLRGALPSTACVFGLAPNTGTLLFGTCAFYLQGPLVTVATNTDPSGGASLPIQILIQPWLRGQRLYAQAFALDAASAPLGLAFTGALALQLGD